MKFADLSAHSYVIEYNGQTVICSKAMSVLISR
jgi:hypothetical protein